MSEPTFPPRPVDAEILTVCTGNICRSAIAELVLATRLRNAPVRVHSAGTAAQPGSQMPSEARRIARGLGAPDDRVDAHRARRLTDALLTTPDLILAMTREHRREIIERAPHRTRSVFTAREFARLADTLSDDKLRAGLAPAGDDPHAVAGSWHDLTLTAGATPSPTVRPAEPPQHKRATPLQRAIALIAAQRGLTPGAGEDDDVVDPYGRERAVYREASAQLIPALNAVQRVILLTTEPLPATTVPRGL